LVLHSTGKCATTHHPRVYANGGGRTIYASEQDSNFAKGPELVAIGNRR
jgi:hypothetical protein